MTFICDKVVFIQALGWGKEAGTENARPLQERKAGQGTAGGRQRRLPAGWNVDAGHRYELLTKAAGIGRQDIRQYESLA